MRRTLSPAAGGAALLLAAALALTGCTQERPGAGSGASGGSGGTGGAPALGAVDALTVKGRAAKSGYAREEFGRGWRDTDGNGCGTREDVLRRDLTGTRLRDGRCTVLSGVLESDPYTGRRLEFRRGRSAVDIDHVVALSDAWQKGARGWTRAKRVAFANDPLNLLAVDARANRRKSDGDAATWLPANKPYRCPYVAAQVAVKRKYGLWVTAGERDAMKRVLSRCPDQHLPAER
ncbi:HNH endonuclease family protein [Streptomyces bambusae]|uniref:HNH endonuclease family protein n=1 Tax=Streptomyces bambusae TaxID=1550616 RepID=UPI001CFF28FC|nr:HNH endonuclease family protein [Streptomyces bambusae]MCB5166257.1 HNH endonuclease family protein [Streptomyces bambusae]